ncbi:MAG TPA: thiamine pyrophosphate-binding protein [Actinomadura sp.]|nr:thiamine pyrophosphate-binding protein [Actinomadura sp.]
MPTAAAATVSLLAAAGSRRFYTVPGESFLEVLDEIERDNRLHLVSVRHESGAAFMAEADGRLTGVPAVALASRGPGATNLSIGVQTASYDGTPLLVLLGQVESHRLGQDAFQEVDLVAFYTPITKWTVQARTAEEIPGLVARALDVATRGRPGPVAIAVPADLWGVEIDAAPSGSRSAPAPVPDPGEMEEIVQAVTGAARPVAVVGGGAAVARDEVVAFAERFGVGVYTSFRRQDMFPAGHPHYLGHLGLGTPEETLTALADADLILLLGTRLDQITSQGYRFPLPHSRVLSIGTDARHGAAILVIVFQNGLYGTIAMHQASRFGRTAGVAIDPVDLTQWARGLGATAFDVQDLRDLTRALELTRDTTGPVVLTVRTDADVISPTTRLSTLTAAHRGGIAPHREEGRPL